MTRSKLELRPATLADAPGCADLETARMPDEPRDGEMIAFWWTLRSGEEVSQRLVAERGGAITAYVGAWHGAWAKARFGMMRVALHPEIWNDDGSVSGSRPPSPG
ncbi:MAG TPA: hypothetical protein VJT78_14510 [Candidatus Dormibacteraeota bacterium]|nr:hypothetical protein [Candidatus Dormibacteraeota bacterium]